MPLRRAPDFGFVKMWRKGWDSNPRYGSPHGSFQDCSLKPLGHPSAGGAYGEKLSGDQGTFGLL